MDYTPLRRGSVRLLDLNKLAVDKLWSFRIMLVIEMAQL